MARLYTYGNLKDINTIPNQNALPGTLVGAWGVRLIAQAFKGSDDIEFGEVVELAQTEAGKAYTISRVDGSTVASKLGVIVRDVVGATFIGAGIVEAPKDSVPVSVMPFGAETHFPVVVPLAGSQTPAVGGKVYIGLGTGSTVAGAVYATAQGAGGVDSIDSGWVFGSLKFKPTTSTGECAVIAKAL